MNAQLVKNPQSAIRNQKSGGGFSLTEVLLAIGTLAVGMLFIAGVFPVAIHFTTLSFERTIGASIADEAFAKIRICDRPSTVPAFPGFTLTPYISPSIAYSDVNTYPSTPTDWTQKRYGWSAICGESPFTGIHTTVFVTRRTGSSGQYFARNAAAWPGIIFTDRPVAVPVRIAGVAPRGRPDELAIDDAVPAPADAINELTFINDGDTIVDDASGRLYRVLERYKPSPWNPYANVILLDQPWQGGTLNVWVWVVPPPVGGGRSPCIAVYQKIIRF